MEGEKMNRFIGSGRLTKNAIVNGGDRKALKFTIAAKYGYDSKEEKERVEFVPCVLFTPPNDKLGIFLAAQGKGVFVEFEGRVHTSKFEKDGETKYSTEVVVDNRTLNIITRQDSAESHETVQAA
jgi:single-stranded DNA-binding protein